MFRIYSEIPWSQDKILRPMVRDFLFLFHNIVGKLFLFKICDFHRKINRRIFRRIWPLRDWVSLNKDIYKRKDFLNDNRASLNVYKFRRETIYWGRVRTSGCQIPDPLPTAQLYLVTELTKSLIRGRYCICFLWGFCTMKFSHLRLLRTNS